MKVNIYSLTESTISLNTIGIFIRGAYDHIKNEPCTVARNITLDSESKINEVNQLEALGLVKVERIDEYDSSKKSNPTVEPTVEPKVEPKVEKVEGDPEGKPKRKSKSKSNPSRKRGRPRKKKQEDSEKIENPEDLQARVNPPAPERLDVQDPEPDSSAVIMTEKGPFSSKAIHKMSGEISEDDSRCDESIKAASKIDKEESGEDVSSLEKVDESKLGLTDRMGGEVVVGTGGGKAEKSFMTDNIVKKQEMPDFLELEDSVFNKSNKDDDVQSAFIDFEEDEEDEEDDLGDAFIEI